MRWSLGRRRLLFILVVLVGLVFTYQLVLFGSIAPQSDQQKRRPTPVLSVQPSDPAADSSFSKEVVDVIRPRGAKDKKPSSDRTPHDSSSSPDTLRSNSNSQDFEVTDDQKDNVFDNNDWLDDDKNDNDVAAEEENSIEPPDRPIRIAIVTAYEEYSRNLRRLVEHNKLMYCQNHGYDYLDARSDPEFADLARQGKNLALLKIRAIQRFLPRYDWIFWSDYDAIFLNHSKKIEDFLDYKYDIILGAGPPTTGTWKKVINTGNYLIRNSKWSRDFFAQAWDLAIAPKCPDTPAESEESSRAHGGGENFNGWIQLCSPTGWWLFDQGLLMWMFRYVPGAECRVKYVGFRDFDSEYPWYDDGDLTVRFPGKSMQQRKELIKLFYERTDWSRGRVKRQGTTKLDRDLTNSDHAKDVTDSVYKVWHRPCRGSSETTAQVGVGSKGWDEN